MRRWIAPALSAVCFLFALSAWAADAGKPDGASGPFEPTWESLNGPSRPRVVPRRQVRHLHALGPGHAWAAKIAPAGGQWYGHEMYDPKNPVFAYHKKHFGDQNQGRLQGLIPQFKAEKFDAEAWADLFARSGAKFAGPVAVHHDNFAMWDSAVTPWNAARMGPHRDITGELEKAIKRHGLKFITTFHHGFAWRYFEPAFAFDGADPQIRRALHRAPQAERAALEGVSGDSGWRWSTRS